MRGRKPKPTGLHEIHGNPSKIDLRKRREPGAPAGRLAPPDGLTDEQRAAWLYAIANAPRGVLRRIDRGLLRIWIIAEDIHRRASTEISKLGLLVKSDKGVAYQNPYLGVMNRQAEIMMRAASELGFSPVARVRLAGGAGAEIPLDDPASTPASTFDAFLEARPTLN